MMKKTARAAHGRAPDPQLPARVYRAAVEVYARTGWAGFTIDAVATRGKVGKAAIYSRWASKQDLLVDALLHAGTESEPQMLRLGSHFRESLVEYVLGLTRVLDEPLGSLMIRLQLEAKLYPEVLGPAIDRLRGLWRGEADQIGRTAVAAGELPGGVSPGLVLDAVRGAVVNRYLLAPGEGPTWTSGTRRGYAERVVGMVLDGALHPAPVDRSARD